MCPSWGMWEDVIRWWWQNGAPEMPWSAFATGACTYVPVCLSEYQVELSCGHLTCWRTLCLEFSSVAGVFLSQPPSHLHQPYVCLSAAAAVSSRICVWKAFSCSFSLSLSCKLRKKCPFWRFICLSGLFRLNSCILWLIYDRLLFYVDYLMKVWAKEIGNRNRPAVCVRIAWRFPCELSFGISNQPINALIGIFGKALFGMSWCIDQSFWLRRHWND